MTPNMFVGIPLVLISPTALFMMYVFVLCPPTIARNSIGRAVLPSVEGSKNASMNPLDVFALTFQS